MADRSTFPPSSSLERTEQTPVDLFRQLDVDDAAVAHRDLESAEAVLLQTGASRRLDGRGSAGRLDFVVTRERGSREQDE